MKKKIVLTVCTTALLLTGCRADSAMLIEYSDLNILKGSDILDLTTAETIEPYSDGIAVITSDILSNPETGSPETSEDLSAETETDTVETGQTTDGISPEPSDTTIDSAANAEPSSAIPGLLVCTTTNEVLYNNFPYKEVAPASLTKLMTALLVLEHGNMDELVTLTAAMNADMIPGAQVCGFVPGDIVSVKELLYSMLVYSGNDAANALAIHIGGNVQNFVAMMNEEANRIGAVNTHFSNPSGLDISNHYSSAYDLYLIFNECLKYDDFKNAVCSGSYTNHYTTASGNTASITYNSTNLYMNGTYTSPDGITVYGGKTGTTDEAGACLIAYSADAAGNKYISVSLGNKDKPELYSQMNKILAKFQK